VCVRDLYWCACVTFSAMPGFVWRRRPGLAAARRQLSACRRCRDVCMCVHARVVCCVTHRAGAGSNAELADADDEDECRVRVLSVSSCAVVYACASHHITGCSGCRRSPRRAPPPAPCHVGTSSRTLQRTCTAHSRDDIPRCEGERRGGGLVVVIMLWYIGEM
jgi:hypothetical protein